MKKDIEILAPAGSYDNFLAAINAGADAIYLGGTAFGARAFSDNFTKDELLHAIDVAHIHNKKVYLTVNTLLKNHEINEQLYEFIEPFYKNGLDAVIVQDLGVLKFIREYFPEIHVHASTQMTITGVSGAELLKELGASRIVTSRELNLEEIKNINQQVDIEIESFVHGALCYCYSGQCLMSSLIGGRSGNRGRCAQPCRLQYDVKMNDTILNSNQEKYVISPKDICTLSILPQIIQAGVHSLKIEGRMKSTEYTAGVISIYRKYVDKYLESGFEKYSVSDDDLNMLKDLYNRGGFSKGYYVEDIGKTMMSLSRPNHQGTKALQVISSENGSVKCKVLTAIDAGDVFEISSDFSYTNKHKISAGGTIVLNIPRKYNVKKGDFIYRVKNLSILNDIKEKYIQTARKTFIEGSIDLQLGKPATMTVGILDEAGNVRSYVTHSEDIIEKAEKQPMDVEKITKQLTKTGSTPYVFKSICVNMDSNVFVPIQKLNDFRRNVLEKMENQLLNMYRRDTVGYSKPLHGEADASYKISKNNKVKLESGVSIDNNNIKINVALENKELLNTVLGFEEISGVYLELSQYNNNLELKAAIESCKNRGKYVYLIMPHIFRLKTKKYFKENMAELINLNTDGFVIKNLEELQFLRNYVENNNVTKSINVILDSNVYTFNNEAKDMYLSLQIQDKLNIIYDTAPIELNQKELKNLNTQNSELIIYGYIPVMVTAQCINKTVGKCDKKNAELFLNDRKNINFAVKSNCKYCYNTIYNASPIYLIDKHKDVMVTQPNSIRIIFTTESKSTVERIIKDTISAFINKKDITNSLDNFTRGHFYRGVD